MIDKLLTALAVALVVLTVVAVFLVLTKESTFCGQDLGLAATGVWLTGTI